MFEGRFNMLKACVTYIRETQAGHGICGVAYNYAVELEREKTLFAGLPHIISLDNATDPSDDANAEIDKLRQQRFESKAALQKYCGLDEDPGVLGWLQWGCWGFEASFNAIFVQGDVYRFNKGCLKVLGFNLCFC